MPFNKTEALRRAEEHVSKGEIAGAIAIHRMIAQADPYDLNTINALGELYVRAGRTREAIDDFTRIADGYLNSGSGIKAAYLLRKALDLDPSNAPALMKLAEIYLLEGMIDKAHDEFIRAGALLVAEGQITGALQANHRALTAKPGSPQARAAIAALQADAAASETGSLRRQPTAEGAKAGSSSALDSEPAGRSSGPVKNLSSVDEESLIQQLSKAEMLVGYGEVDRAIALLQDLVTRSPDNLDVHGKLKDVYLRNEMIREAGQECRELARIHEARGESARASEYTMRAARLALSSGELAAELVKPVKAPDFFANPKPQSVAAPGLSSASKSAAPEPSIEAEPAAAPAEQPPAQDRSLHPPEMISAKQVGHEASPASFTPVVSKTLPPAAPVRTETESHAPGVSTIVSQPPRQPVTHYKPLSERASGSLGLRVSEAPIVTAPMPERSIASSTVPQGSNSLAVPSTLALARAASAPLSSNRTRWMYVAPMALVGAIALTFGAMKGASMYGSRLDTQYAELALASPSAGQPSPPGLPSEEVLDGRAETEVVKIDPPSAQIVTPAGPVAGQEIAVNQPPATEAQPKAGPAAISESPKVIKPASPPMVAVTDQRGGENVVPRGLMTGAPQTIAPVPSPPPSAPAPQRASAVIKGEVIKQVQPDYPAIARGARQEGAVPVEVSINEKGDVVSARAMAGPVLLRSAAESAARQWKFKPSTRDGRPLSTVTTINFRFRL